MARPELRTWSHIQNDYIFLPDSLQQLLCAHRLYLVSLPEAGPDDQVELSELVLTEITKSLPGPKHGRGGKRVVSPGPFASHLHQKCRTKHLQVLRGIRHGHPGEFR